MHLKPSTNVPEGERSTEDDEKRTLPKTAKHKNKEKDETLCIWFAQDRELQGNAMENVMSCLLFNYTTTETMSL